MTAFRHAGTPSGEPTSARTSTGQEDPSPGAIRSPRALVASAVQQQIIPRLIQAHAPVTLAPDLAALTGRPIGAADVQELVRLVLLPDEQPARACVEALRQRGIPVETLYTDLLALGARYLGQLWEDDLCCFADVTVGVGRLQQILRDLTPGLVVEPDSSATPLRVLLVPCPGEQHSFGLVMVAEFFRSAGWDVSGGPSQYLDVAAAVRSEWFDVVGFSLAASVHFSRLAPTIAAVRKSSRNPRLGVMVGGPMFLGNPALVGEVGADAMAVDGSLAPEIAAKLVGTRAIPC